MVDQRPDLRALVLNYRGAAMTLQVVRDLLAMEDVVMSIVVIDNGSGEAEQAALGQALNSCQYVHTQTRARTHHCIEALRPCAALSETETGWHIQQEEL